MSAYTIKKHTSQQGILLLEALIAILIFSLGILGIMGLQTTSAKQSSDAKFRSDAGLLAEELIGKMWVTDRKNATLINQFQSPNGTDYVTWMGTPGSPASGTVRAILPGADVNPPTVTIDANNKVTITINWQAPYEVTSGTIHQYSVVTQIQYQ